MIKEIICFIIGHKNMYIFEEPDSLVIENNNNINKVKHICFCERCHLCFWN